MGLKDKARDIMWNALYEVRMYLFENSHEEVKQANMEMINKCEDTIKDTFDQCTTKFYELIIRNFEIINKTKYEHHEDRIEEMTSVVLDYADMCENRDDIRK